MQASALGRKHDVGELSGALTGELLASWQRRVQDLAHKNWCDSGWPAWPWFMRWFLFRWLACRLATPAWRGGVSLHPGRGCSWGEGGE